MTEPAREIFWNIPYHYIMYIIGALVVATMVWAVYRRYKMWHIGKPDPRLKGHLLRRWGDFIKAAIIDGILHRKFIGVADNLGHRSPRGKDFIPREFVPGIAHFLIAIGCCLLLLGTALDVFSHYTVEFLKGNMYFAHSMFTDIGGLMALVGVIIAAVRRYGQKPDRLDNKTGDLMALLAIVIIIVSGFVVEGLRVAADEIVENPAWSRWSPGGYLLAGWFRSFDHGALLVAHRTLWWIHSLVTFGFLVYIALYFNRLWHIVLSPLNVFWRNTGPRGAMVPIDMEKAESFGVSKIEDYTWKDMLDLDACTRCGRCQDNCPAYLSGKPLSPKKVIQDLKGEFLSKAPALLAAQAKTSPSPADRQADGGNSEIIGETTGERPLVGGVIETDAVWNCTTCFACQEVCPVWVEPMAKLGEMRRNLVLEQASIPESGEGALRSIEDRGHPWRGTTLTREGWMEGLDVNLGRG